MACVHAESVPEPAHGQLIASPAAHVCPTARAPFFLPSCVRVCLAGKFRDHFKDADVKYIEPTCMIRSIPTTAGDRVYCKMLAHGAVHGAFAGYTGITVGLVNTHVGAAACLCFASGLRLAVQAPGAAVQPSTYEMLCAGHLHPRPPSPILCSIATCPSRS